MTITTKFALPAALCGAILLGTATARAQNFPQADGDREHQAEQNKNQHESHGSTSHDRDGDERGGLGVFISDTRSGGVEIERVVDGSPAADAGLRAGDRILRVNGRPVNSTDELSRMVARQEAGSRIDLDLIRDGRRRNLEARLASRQEALPERSDRMRDSRRTAMGDQRQDRRDSYEGTRAAWLDRDDNQRGDNRVDGDQRLRRLEGLVDRLSRRVDQLQRRLDGARDNRTGDVRDGRDFTSEEDETFPRDERYDADFDRSSQPGVQTRPGVR